MMHKSEHKTTPHLVFGLIIIALGLIFTLDHLGLLEAGSYLQYWPALLMVYGLSKVLQRGSKGLLSALFFIVIGGLLLLNNLEVLEFDIWDLWPLILVLIGSMLVWRTFNRHRSSYYQRIEHSESNVNAFVVLGGVERKNSSQDFKGGELTVILGGIELDLRSASMKGKEAVIDVFTFWGGIDIKVPEDWTVSIEGMPLMGGCEDKTRHETAVSEKHLVIKGYVIMGGLEIGH